MSSARSDRAKRWWNQRRAMMLVKGAKNRGLRLPEKVTGVRDLVQMVLPGLPDVRRVSLVRYVMYVGWRTIKARG